MESLMMAVAEVVTAVRAMAASSLSTALGEGKVADVAGLPPEAL